MTNQDADFRQSLIAAVQAELERHAAAVVSEVDRVRQQGSAETAALRAEMQGQISALAQLVQQAAKQAETNIERVKETFEARVVEAESRATRRIDDVTAGIDATVAAAARPVMQGFVDDHRAMGERVGALEQLLRRFDEQAARMVNYVSDVTQQVDARQAQAVEEIKADVEARIGVVTRLVEDTDSSVRRVQMEINQQVSTRLNDAEDRFNSRLLAAEARMAEDAGAKIAAVQAHVGRVDAHIDETLSVVNNRFAAVDEQLESSERRIAEAEQRLAGVDRDALDELANKMSAAVGEAMLVRIEMERAEKQLNERTDTLAVRLTEVETQIQDVTMDVSTAVQLDRLEEVERMVAELDPNKFVLRDGVAPISGLPAPGDVAPVSADLDAYPVAPASIFGIGDRDDAETELNEIAEGMDQRVDHGAA